MNLQPLGIENGSPLTAHTIDVDLLRGGWVLDAGCRGFEFAIDVSHFGCKSMSLDPSQDVIPPVRSSLEFRREALVAAVNGQLYLKEIGDGSGSHIVKHQSGDRCYMVRSVTVTQLMDCYEIDLFDAVKLDIEGAEFEVLANWPGPIAKQINVAFHSFMYPPVMRQELGEAARRQLSKWYKPVQDEASVRHGHDTPCHWDSLFVLK